MIDTVKTSSPRVNGTLHFSCCSQEHTFNDVDFGQVVCPKCGIRYQIRIHAIPPNQGPLKVGTWVNLLEKHVQGMVEIPPGRYRVTEDKYEVLDCPDRDTVVFLSVDLGNGSLIYPVPFDAVREEVNGDRQDAPV